MLLCLHFVRTLLVESIWLPVVNILPRIDATIPTPFVYYNIINLDSKVFNFGIAILNEYYIIPPTRLQQVTQELDDLIMMFNCELGHVEHDHHTILFHHLYSFVL